MILSHAMGSSLLLQTQRNPSDHQKLQTLVAEFHLTCQEILSGSLLAVSRLLEYKRRYLQSAGNDQIQQWEVEMRNAMTVPLLMQSPALELLHGAAEARRHGHALHARHARRHGPRGCRWRRLQFATAAARASRPLLLHSTFLPQGFQRLESFNL